jgi:hypothetical protein
MWSRLRNHGLGVKFRRQHPIGPYMVDFFCREAGLVVEVDPGPVRRDGWCDPTPSARVISNSTDSAFSGCRARM